MTTIHAAIYSQDRNVWIALGQWIESDEAGIRSVEALDDALRSDVEAFAADVLDGQDDGTHRVAGDVAMPATEPMTPRLLLFRCRGATWLARGFRPWGTTAETGTTLGVIATEAGEGDGAFIWAQRIARLIYAMRGTTAAADPALKLADAEPAGPSFAVPSADRMPPELGQTAESDFAGLQDSDI